jgi:hypothetical protein
MPGSHIPIFSPSALENSTPDYVVILPWNISAEVRDENAALGKRGAKFLTVVPELTII